MWSRFIIYIVVGAIVLILLSFSPKHFLEKGALLGEIATGAAALIALLSFLYQRDRDNTTSVIDNIAFFRKEILTSYNRLSDEIKILKPDYQYPCVRLESFSIVDWEVEHEDISQQQKAILLKDDANDKIVQRTQLELLNALEDFSLRVMNTETFDHEAMASVRSSFVQAVEQNFSGLCYLHIVWGSSFPGIQSLYMKWRDSVDREPREERLKRVAREVRAKKNSNTTVST